METYISSCIQSLDWASGEGLIDGTNNIPSIQECEPEGDDCPNCYNPIADAGEPLTYSGNCQGSYTQICLDGTDS